MLCKKGNLKDIEKYNLKWCSERKYDGIRCIAIINNGEVTLNSRSGRKINNQFLEIVDDLKKIEGNHILDGEICCETFSITQSRNQTENKLKTKLLRKKYPANYYVFDYVCNKTLFWRGRELSYKIFQRYNFEFVNRVTSSTDLKEMWEKAERENWEGIIIKDLDSYYKNDRSSKWKKIKRIKCEDIKVTSYSVNPAGVRCETDKGIAVQVSGSSSLSVKNDIDKKGYCLIEINFLNKTKQNKYRQPTFKKKNGN